MYQKLFSWLILIVLLFAGCQYPGYKNSHTQQYSFFVAGHTYGSPVRFVKGLHPPFREKFNLLNDNPEIEFGILAGDIVAQSTPEQWGLVDEALKGLKKPVYFVAGNHDISDRKFYESRYGPTLYDFRRNGDLFIILDSNRKNWSFAEEDINYLKSELSDLTGVRNVFIFSHHLVWVPGDDRFSEITLNWPPQVPENTNFWSEIFPILNKLENRIYWFAGDLGANGPATAFCYHEEENVVLVGTGMGEGKKDNIVVVHVNKDHTVNLHLIALNGDNINALGNPEDYISGNQLKEKM